MANIAAAKAKRRITLVWFLGAGFLFLMVLLQTIFGKYGERAEDAWGWLLPTVMPTLSLILGVLVSDQMGRTEAQSEADRFLFVVVLVLSGFYLLVVSSTLLLAPFAAMSPLELMKASSLWLGPLQGLVCGGLSAFFVVKPKPKPKSG